MRRYLLILFMLLFLTACRAESTAELTPQEILTRSAQRMQELMGFQVSIDRSGASAFLDYNQTLSFSKLSGHYVAPDRVQATVRVIGPGIVVEVEVISIGSTQWQTNIITGQWEQLPEDWGFNPATLLEAEHGLPAILIADLSNLQVNQDAELDEMPGKKLYLLSGILAGETLYDLSNWLIGPDAMNAQIWIDPQTFDLHRAVLIEHAGDSDLERTWQIDFWDFDSTIDIQPPQ
jgi:hypothetical protein